MADPLAAVRWRCVGLDALALPMLYRLLALRESVFVVEQRCAYQELDGRDLTARHLLGEVDGELVACLRILSPETAHGACALGRVLTAASWRGLGLGHALMREGLVQAERCWPGRDVALSAQVHLQDFYRQHGFVTESSPYDEDGILHVDMRRPGTERRAESR